MSLTGRDGVLIHQYFGLRVMLGIVVDGAESRLDPAAFNDALTQGRWIKVTPGLEALHDPNSDQDDRGCKQNKNATMDMYSETGSTVGTILSIIAHEAKPVRKERSVP